MPAVSPGLTSIQGKNEMEVFTLNTG